MEIEKIFQYRERAISKQRKKYFSPESVKLRNEKKEQYRNTLIKRQLDKRNNGELKCKNGLRKFSQKMVNMHNKDAIFYENIWKERKHYCENCNKWLGDNFKDKNGKIIVYRYAHIIPKSVYPYLRHNPNNIMLLCLACHTQFDNSPKEVVENMKCYDEQKINDLKKLHKELEFNKNEIYK